MIGTSNCFSRGFPFFCDNCQKLPPPTKQTENGLLLVSGKGTGKITTIRKVVEKERYEWEGGIIISGIQRRV